MKRLGRENRSAWSAIRCGFLALLIIAPLPACRKQVPVVQDQDIQLVDREMLNEEEIAKLDGPVAAFCADCHAPPDPASFPKGNWSEEVARGFEFYERSGRDDLVPTNFEMTVRYYQTQAPDELVLEPPLTDLESSPIVFRPQQISPPGGRVTPGVSDFFWDNGRLLMCDMSSGDILQIDVKADELSSEPVYHFEAPAHIERADQLFPGTSGYLVAALGTYAPEDHDRGRVHFQPDAEGEASSVLLENVGRVADVAMADFDGDGKQDLVVAEFGWIDTGGLHLLLNRGATPASPHFELTEIDPRHGASHVFAVELNGDDQMDLIALHSQEFETVDAYINLGEGAFEKRELYAAPQPDYGSSSIDLADFDGDGDLDVVLSNGDSLDTYIPKPHHSIQLLVNQGDLQFQRRELGKLPGAYGAKFGDLDGDGDIDVAACAMTLEKGTLNTVVWYEQVDGEFLTHALDLGTDQHAALEIGDFDEDGDLDIAVGEFEQLISLKYHGTIWWNEGPRKPGPQL